ncbi:phage tail protein [Limosilactobacillus reuteri]|uniref:phage tail protein n=1 Tax=Limosilactobacillus reuteri TaxID=1598 RepID=UPI001E5E40DC|nr:phage tail protein [Limosilactobacillus reuteri]MCC4389437.1 phage tail protein [Limosilactobacillus reuteri]MCC4391213.1 phage tail protein [Limosilactobacillus reuteri]MCC4428141.1 phage tail protein [Limosilactobacillus reuteri]MCC4432030.1 phage tail protein [Limosilactobacillus reuteri]MCC4434042.1 phage tail protein [Limosilactobacillus reuteri]
MYRIIGYNEPTDKAGFIVLDPRVNRHISSGKLTLKESNIDDLTITVNQASPLWDNVRPYHTHVNVYDDNELIFRGRAIKPKKSMEESGQFIREYVFEDIEAYLMDSTQRFYEGVGQTPKEFLQTLIDVHNSQVPDYKKFQLRNVNVTNNKDDQYRQIDYPKTSDAINDKLVKSLGGYIVTTYNPNGINYLDYLTDIGVDHKDDTPIQLAKNMKSASMQIDPTKVITRLIPLGKTLEPSKVDVSDDGGDGGSGSLDSPEEFCKSEINATWGSDINNMKQDFAARSSRVRAWGVDVNRLYDVVKNAGVSPEWFFAYELQEQGTYYGWLNHTYRHGDAYSDAQSVCEWIKNCSNSNSINPAWSAPEGSIAPNQVLADKWNQEFGKGTIGRVYLQGTAAAVWDLAGQTPNPAIGKPISGCISCIKRWGGHSNATGGTWGWPFPDVGEGHFSQVQSFGNDGGYRQNSYHDGVDFGSVDHPGREVHCIHGGTVTIKSAMGGLGNFVVIHTPEGFNIVYQEAFSSPSNIIVNVGQKVKTGDVIGYRDTDHVHIGVTKQDFYQAVRNSFSPAGGWLDPVKLIKEGGDGSKPQEGKKDQTVDNSNAARPKLTITTVNNGRDYIDIPDLQKEFGIIEGTVEFDNVDDPNVLMQQAQTWIKAQRIPQSWEVTALELHMANFKSFKVADRYMFINPNVAKSQLLRITQKEIDLLKPHASSLTIGDKTMGLTDYQLENQVNFQQFKEMRVMVNQVVQTQEQSANNNNKVMQNFASSADLAQMRQDLRNLQDDNERARKGMVSIEDFNKLKEQVEKLTAGGDDSGK